MNNLKHYIKSILLQEKISEELHNFLTNAISGISVLSGNIENKTANQVINGFIKSTLVQLNNIQKNFPNGEKDTEYMHIAQAAIIFKLIMKNLLGTLPDILWQLNLSFLKNPNPSNIPIFIADPNKDQTGFDYKLNPQFDINQSFRSTSFYRAVQNQVKSEITKILTMPAKDLFNKIQATKLIDDNIKDPNESERLKFDFSQYSNTATTEAGSLISAFWDKAFKEKPSKDVFNFLGLQDHENTWGPILSPTTHEQVAPDSDITMQQQALSQQVARKSNPVSSLSNTKR